MLRVVQLPASSRNAPIITSAAGNEQEEQRVREERHAPRATPSGTRREPERVAGSGSLRSVELLRADGRAQRYCPRTFGPHCAASTVVAAAVCDSDANFTVL